VTRGRRRSPERAIWLGGDRTIEQVKLQAYADRICEVLDAQPEPVILVGHSMGGVAVTQAAEMRPEKIAKLVYVADATYYIEPLNRETLAKIIEVERPDACPRIWEGSRAST